MKCIVRLGIYNQLQTSTFGMRLGLAQGRLEIPFERLANCCDNIDPTVTARNIFVLLLISGNVEWRQLYAARQ